MKVHLITLAAFPHSSAESIHLAMFSKSMAQKCDYTLVTALKWWRPSSIFSSPWLAYGLEEKAFRTKKFFQLLPRCTGFIDRSLQVARREEAIVYARQIIVASKAVNLDLPTVLELHTFPEPNMREFLGEIINSTALKKIIVISNALKVDILDAFDVPEDKIFIAPDAADEEKFSCSTNFNQKTLVCGYIGNCFPGKGVEILKPLSDMVENNSIEVYGASEKDFNEREYRGLKLNGRIPYASVPAAMSSFQVALLPNQPQVIMRDGSDIGKYTSPMKLFEYMASGKAIIASDLPILREVLEHENNALLVPHDNPAEWAKAIMRLEMDRDLAKRLGESAKKCFLRKYSYRSRAENILSVM